jgi:hypothetical protein
VRDTPVFHDLVGSNSVAGKVERRVNGSYTSPANGPVTTLADEKAVGEVNANVYAAVMVKVSFL